jgi:outer membrane lipoprotein-sorting protein
MPAWWEKWRRVHAFRSGFAQEGESAAFGKLTRTGKILAAKGGRLRLEYDKGALLLSDGRVLTQYDPSTRTAQRFEIEGAMDEWPLLRVLLEPLEIDRAFDVRHLGDGKLTLAPKRPGLPKVTLEGRGGFPHRIEWKDGTGAKQVLTLTDPKAVSDPSGGTFDFVPPKGTKWVK